MTAIRSLLVLAATALAALIYWASSLSWIGESFASIWSDPWGKVTVVDLYLGFFAAAGFIWLVEKPGLAIMLIVALLVLGNLVRAVWLAVRLPKLAILLRAPR